MTSLSGLGLILWSPAAKAAEPAGVSDVSKTIASGGSKPNGYKGADGKVSIDANGTISTSSQINGTDAGFYVGFRPIATNGASKLQLEIKGDVFQTDQWDHYLSIQVTDSNGNQKSFEICNEGEDPICTGKTPMKYASLKSAQSIVIDISSIEDISRISVVFLGSNQIDAGFKVSDIKLLK